MRTIFSLLVIVSLIQTTIISGQKNTSNSSELIRNLLMLGREDKAFDTAAEILSNSENKKEQSDILFMLGEYNFLKFFVAKENEEYLIRSNRLYNDFIIKYPQDERIPLIKMRLNYANSFIIQGIENYAYLSKDYLEKYIVDKKIFSANLLAEIKNPNAISFFVDEQFKEKPESALDKYYDDIIINHPKYEVIAYYQKIIVLLSWFENDFVKSGLIKVSHDKLNWNSEDQSNIIGYSNNMQIKTSQGIMVDATKKKIFEYLDIMEKKYPDNSLTLDLHLILAKIEMKFNKHWEEHGKKIKDLLEFILKNDRDNLDLRYFVTKEFLLSHTFKE
jgi:hypothetical protein